MSVLSKQHQMTKYSADQSSKQKPVNQCHGFTNLGYVVDQVQSTSTNKVLGRPATPISQVIKEHDGSSLVVEVYSMCWPISHLQVVVQYIIL